MQFYHNVKCQYFKDFLDTWHHNIVGEDLFVI